MVYLQDLVEIAYFKSEIIRCRYQLIIDDTVYWVYFQGPTETAVRWNLKDNVNWNDLNFSGTIYIQRNEQTLDYFNRFTKIKIDGHTWQVKVVDTLTVPGIIELEIGEYYDSITEDLIEINQVVDTNDSHIEYEITGQQEVYPYESYVYSILDTGGEFIVDNTNKAKIIEQEDGQCKIEIISGRRGNFNLIYIKDELSYVLPITILSL
jgi:hypothetical protein